MAGTVTHYYFAKVVYNNFDKKTKKNIYRYLDTLYMFTQGPDTLLFYRLNKKLSQTIHRNNTQGLFINTINYILDNKLQHNYEIMAFLYGFICHYILDTTLHPYVNYKTGIYNSKHNIIEKYIDSYYIFNNENVLSHKYKVHRYLFNNKMSKTLNRMIDEVFYKTYDLKHMANKFNKGKKHMKILYYLMRYDPYKIKYNIYRCIDWITPRKFMKFTPISYYCNLDNNEYYLNLNHNKWCHPLDNSITSNKSVLELYDEALNKAINNINIVNNIIYNKKDKKELYNLFTNLSMSSGYDCNNTSDYRYFEE